MDTKKHNPKTVGNIVISGKKSFVSDITSALNLLLEKDPKNWEFVQKNLTEILESEHSGVTCEEGIFKFKNKPYNSKWIASVLIHESWHIEYFLTGEPYDGEEAERRCMEKQNEFLALVGYKKINIEKLLKTKYWEVDYEERDW
ncbi:MAG: hypothetical protein V1914_00750 [archaeon]